MKPTFHDNSLVAARSYFEVHYPSAETALRQRLLMESLMVFCFSEYARRWARAARKPLIREGLREARPRLLRLARAVTP